MTNTQAIAVSRFPMRLPRAVDFKYRNLKTMKCIFISTSCLLLTTFLKFLWQMGLIKSILCCCCFKFGGFPPLLAPGMEAIYGNGGARAPLWWMHPTGDVVSWLRQRRPHSNIVPDLLTVKQILPSPSRSLNRHQARSKAKGQASNPGDDWGGVALWTITWSEKTLSGWETSLELCAVTQNRHTGQRYWCRIAPRVFWHPRRANKTWHPFLLLGIFFVVPADIFFSLSFPSHHHKLQRLFLKFLAGLGSQGVFLCCCCFFPIREGLKDNLSHSKFGICGRSAPVFLGDLGDTGWSGHKSVRSCHLK